MKRNLTTHEKIHWALGCNEIENEFAQHCYYHGNGEQRPGFETSVKWSKREDISSAHGFGGVLGPEGIKNWTLGMNRMYESDYEKLVKMYPDVEGKNKGQLAEFAMHTLASSIIEIAEDGMSAKASFYTPGIILSNRSWRGTKFAMWLWERYGEDWVWEDGEWKVLHNQVAPDVSGMVDVGNCAQQSNDTLEKYGAYKCSTTGPPGIVIPGPAHIQYHPVQVPQDDTCPWPEPYETLNDESGYYIPKPGHGKPFVKVFEGAEGDTNDLLRMGPPA